MWGGKERAGAKKVEVPGRRPITIIHVGYPMPHTLHHMRIRMRMHICIKYILFLLDSATRRMYSLPLELPSIADSTNAAPPQLAVHGRLLAHSGGSAAVNLFDTQDLSPLASCASVRHLSCLRVVDLSDEVRVRTLAFTCDGLLAVAGACTGVGQAPNRAVLHVYALVVSSSGGVGSVLTSREGIAQCARLSMAVLPHMTSRLSLDGIEGMRLLPHPVLGGVLALALYGDCCVRFYNVQGVGAATSSAALTAREAITAAALPTLCGVIECAAPIFTEAISEDGAAVAAATVSLSGRCEVSIFRMVSAVAPVAGSAAQSRVATLRAIPACTLRCEMPVSALRFLPVPAAPDAAAYSRFALNRHALLTGHSNGFVNVWWCGNLRRGSNTMVVPHLTSPLASYPPFSASRGPVTHLSPATVVDTLRAPGTASSSTSSNLLSAGRRMQSNSSSGSGSDALFSGTDSAGPASVVFVGAPHTRGWRPLVFPHCTPALTSVTVLETTPPQYRAVASIAAGGGGDGLFGSRNIQPIQPHQPLASATTSMTTEFPDLLPPVFSYDTMHGRRVLIPPAARDVSALLQPSFTCPTLAECARAGVIGNARRQGERNSGQLGVVDSTATNSLVDDTASFVPLCATMITHHPCAMDAWVENQRTASGDDDISSSKSSIRSSQQHSNDSRTGSRHRLGSRVLDVRHPDIAHFHPQSASARHHVFQPTIAPAARISSRGANSANFNSGRPRVSSAAAPTSTRQRSVGVLPDSHVAGTSTLFGALSRPEITPALARLLLLRNASVSASSAGRNSTNGMLSPGDAMPSPPVAATSTLSQVRAHLAVHRHGPLAGSVAAAALAAASAPDLRRPHGGGSLLTAADVLAVATSASDSAAATAVGAGRSGLVSEIISGRRAAAPPSYTPFLPFEAMLPRSMKRGPSMSTSAAFATIKDASTYGLGLPSASSVASLSSAAAAQLTGTDRTTPAAAAADAAVIASSGAAVHSTMASAASWNLLIDDRFDAINTSAATLASDVLSAPITRRAAVPRVVLLLLNAHGGIQAVGLDYASGLLMQGHAQAGEAAARALAVVHRNKVRIQMGRGRSERERQAESAWSGTRPSALFDTAPSVSFAAAAEEAAVGNSSRSVGERGRRRHRSSSSCHRAGAAGAIDSKARAAINRRPHSASRVLGRTSDTSPIRDRDAAAGRVRQQSAAVGEGAVTAISAAAVAGHQALDSRPRWRAPWNRVLRPSSVTSMDRPHSSSNSRSRVRVWLPPGPPGATSTAVSSRRDSHAEKLTGDSQQQQQQQHDYVPVESAPIVGNIGAASGESTRSADEAGNSSSSTSMIAGMNEGEVATHHDDASSNIPVTHYEQQGFITPTAVELPLVAPTTSTSDGGFDIGEHGASQEFDVAIVTDSAADSTRAIVAVDTSSVLRRQSDTVRDNVVPETSSLGDLARLRVQLRSVDAALARILQRAA